MDNCWWGAAELLDRLAEEEDAIVTPFLTSNACWGRWIAAGGLGEPPLAECGPKWLECSEITGCIAEDLLRVSIERIGAARAVCPVKANAR